MRNEHEANARTLKRKVEEDSVLLEKIVESIITKYNRDLDEFIQRMKRSLTRSDVMSDDELEASVMKIPVFLYFAVGGLESLGIEGDTAKAHKIEVFNKAYADVEGTIQDKTKHAELNSFPEYLIEVAYARAYKKLKSQIDAAEHVFSGAKKVLSKRMMEIELTSRDSGGVRSPQRRRSFDD